MISEVGPAFEKHTIINDKRKPGCLSGEMHQRLPYLAKWESIKSYRREGSPPLSLVLVLIGPREKGCAGNQSFGRCCGEYKSYARYSEHMAWRDLARIWLALTHAPSP